MTAIMLQRFAVLSNLYLFI